MIDLDKLVVVDIETIKNLFTIYLKDVKTGSEKHYVIYDHPTYDKQAQELFQFLRKCVRNNFAFITYNGLAFDMQVLHYFYDWCCEKIDPLYEFSNSFIVEQLYKKANEIINVPDNERFEKLLPESKLFLPTIDLFVQNHYNVPGKYTSLKWLEFTMRRANIEEMPVEHTDDVQFEQIDDVLSYNREDVLATHDFYTRIKHETELRVKLTETYKVNVINSSEPSMAKKLFGKFLCKEMGITYRELRSKKTIRKTVEFKDIILPYINYITPELKNFLTEVNEVVIDCNPHSKQKFETILNFAGLEVTIALGGIHGCITSGVYEPTEDEVIKDSDVKSFYPNLSIVNGIKPKHLGDSFLTVYKDIYEQRKVIPKKDPINYIFKIILNSAYGLSSEINSFFYDKKFTYTITINGQLSLLMLAEALTIGVPGIKILQMNTDGLTYVYKKKYEEKVQKICAWWEKLTKLELEHAFYSKMIIRDVNNYIAVDTKGNIKKKGLFETELFYHKNHSNLVIPKALEAYFLHGIPVETFITNFDNIFDFCAGVKKKANFELNLFKQLNGVELVEPQQKVLRFIVSKPDEYTGKLYKQFNDGRKTDKVGIVASHLVKPLNKINTEHLDPKLYNIDYSFYITECKKIIDVITPKVTQAVLDF